MAKNHYYWRDTNNESEFYQLKLEKNGNGEKCLCYYKFNKEYKKVNADLKKIGWNNARYVDSYIPFTKGSICRCAE